MREIDKSSEPVFAALHSQYVSQRGFDVLVTPSSRKLSASFPFLATDELELLCLSQLTARTDRRAANATGMHRYLRGLGYSVSDDRVRRAWNAARRRATLEGRH